MAKNNQAGTAGQAAALPEAVPFEDRPPLYKAFEWSDPLVCDAIPAHSAISFFNLTRDITDGAVTALQLVERCRLDADSGANDEDRPLLSTSDQYALMRLAIGALRALSTEAESRNEWIDKCGPVFKAREKAERAKGGV